MPSVLRSLLLAVAVAAVLLGGGRSTAFADQTFHFAVGVNGCDDAETQQLCTPVPSVALPTDGALQVQFTAAPSHCSDIVARIRVDGLEQFVSAPLAPGEGTGVLELGPVTAGVHHVGVQAEGVLGGCNPGSLAIWSGTLSLTVSGLTAADVAIAAPGEEVGISTLAGGAAGLEAIYAHPASGTGLATLAGATYEQAFQPEPAPAIPLIGGVAFVDLLLLGGEPGGAVGAIFLPPNPIVPPNPIQPPTAPIVPPNPIRLAYWDAVMQAWAPVLESDGAPAAYVAATNSFSVAFSDTSAPQVSGLTGTVFGFVASFGFAGFEPPVDSGVLNVAKAGRAIPLKWRLYDLGNNPVTDLAPDAVSVTSVSVDCEGLTGEASEVEAYTTGASGLQNLGDGFYQLNWATLKSHAGTCRRVRLGLGEQNPDGSPFYRTADFRFTR